MLFGIDCASHQGYPDWEQLAREGHTFMVTKVNGEGAYVNPYWRENHDRARAAGLIPGSYDWVEPQMAQFMTGEEAAADYLRVVGDRLRGSLLTVDFESPEWNRGILGSDVEEWMKRYLYALKQRSRQEVIVYSAPYFMRETGAQRWAWMGQDFKYWMAAPGSATGTHNMLPDTVAWPATVTGPWRQVLIHQHQWFARSPAVRQHFDRNRFRGTRAELAALTLKHGEVSEVQVPEPGKFTAYVDPVTRNPIFVWNMGGQAGPDGILGIDIKDMGMTVASATEEGMQVSASIQNTSVQPHHASRRQG